MYLQAISVCDGCGSMWEYVQGVDDTGDVTQDGQQNVDEEVSTTTSLKEDT